MRYQIYKDNVFRHTVELSGSPKVGDIILTSEHGFYRVLQRVHSEYFPKVVTLHCETAKDPQDR
jgi:hypothetical protein